MHTVKTTLIPESKNRTVYVDAEEAISWFEQKHGIKATKNAADVFRAYAAMMNEAYEDGYKDGKEAAAV